MQVTFFRHNTKAPATAAQHDYLIFPFLFYCYCKLAEKLSPEEEKRSFFCLKGKTNSLCKKQAREN